MTAFHKSTLTRKVISAITVLGGAQAVGTLCSVVRTKLMAVWIGTAGVGLNSILFNSFTLMSNLTQLNLRDSGVREIASASTAAEVAVRRVLVRRWAMLLGLLGAIATLAAAPLLSWSAYGGSMSHTLSFAALSPAVFCAAIASGEFAVFQADGQLGKIARANMMTVVIVTLSCIPLFYFLRIKAIIPVIDLSAIALACCALTLRDRNTRPANGLNLSFKTFWDKSRRFIKLGAAISAGAMLTSLMNYVFAAYVSSRDGQEALGVYQAGYTLVTVYIGVVISAIATEYFPRLTRHLPRKTTSGIIMAHEYSTILAILTPLAIVFILCSDWIVRLLYSSDFAAANPYLIFAAPGAVLRGLSLCFAYRILAAGDAKTYLLTELASVTVGLTLNIAAYSHWSYAGLGLAYTAWYLFYALMTAAVCRRHYSVMLPARLYLHTLLAMALISVVTILKHQYINITP